MSAGAWRSVHKWLTILWGVLFIPSVLLWEHSVPFLVFVSVYANMVGHFSSWQAARVEKRMENEEEPDP